MEELERWRDDALPEYALAKRAHAQLGPDAAQLQRMLVRVEASAGAVAASRPHGGSLAKGWLWLVPLLGLLAAAGWLWREAPRERAFVAPTPRSQSAAPLRESAAPSPPVAAPQSEPSDSKPAVETPARSRRAAPIVSDPVAELALLERARRILARDPARALALTDEHRRSFRAPSFAEERELLAIQALLDLAHRSAAERRAEAFNRSYPNSVHSHRLEVIMQENTK